MFISDSNESTIQKVKFPIYMSVFFINLFKELASSEKLNDFQKEFDMKQKLLTHN